MTADWQPEGFAALLRLQVRQLDLDPRLRRRFDSSDLVQETLLRAHRQRDQFRGGSEGEFRKWLQVILANVIRDEVDKALADKRDVTRERSINAAVAESSARIDAFLASREPSPSEVMARQELLLRVAEAIDELPADQRDAFILHHLIGTPLAEAAPLLNRTEKAVAGLLFRARTTLARVLRDAV
jgi:RNA polymerase sigma-70 factor (ECF subfamily)